MRRFVAVAAVLALGTPLVAGAHPEPVSDGTLQGRAKQTSRHHQHGGDHGHLPASDANVRLVGKAAINQDNKEGRVADVGVFGDYAYLGAFWEPSCQKGGVYVFDIADPTKPKQINFIRTSNDSYVGEGVQVIHIDTPKFNGDVLVMNNEICNEDKGDEKHPDGGMTLVDVTNPKVHKYLAEHVGDVAADGSVNEIHSVFIWDVGDKAYAVQVDNEEQTDVDIFDITDPRNPVFVRDYDLDAMTPSILQPGLGLDSVFHHDVVVKEVSDGVWHMLVSYWDAGYVVLDVSDPGNATFVRDSDFTNPDPEAAASGFIVRPEGNGHEAEFTRNNQYIVAADEDFNPYKVIASNVDDGTTFTAVQGSAVPGVPDGDSIDGDTVYVGLACNGDAAVPAGGPGKIAVVERGVCTFQEKYDNVVAAGGYEAVLVFNRENSAVGDGCDTLITMLVSGDLPAFFTTRRVGFDLFDADYVHADCVAGDGTQTLTDRDPTKTVGISGDDVSLESFFDGWGYVHLYANSGAKLTELDTYAIPEAHDPAYASGFGDLSVHEAATSPTDTNLVYFAYYSGGFRVARIVGNQLQEVGHFIDEGGNNFWGVQVFDHDGKEYVAASDRDFGLYIFEYTPPTP